MTGLFGRQFLIAMTLFIGLGANAWADEDKSEPRQRSIMGWVEYIELLPWDLRTKVKLDTGAKTSSIHAENIELFERKGDEWARFEFEFKDADTDKIRHITIEAPVQRTVYIKRHKAKTQSRPVVELEICINSQIHKGEFSLIDRSRFIYPVLLGRRLLKDIAIVDPGNTFLADKTCKVSGKKKKRQDKKDKD